MIDYEGIIAEIEEWRGSLDSALVVIRKLQQMDSVRSSQGAGNGRPKPDVRTADFTPRRGRKKMEPKPEIKTAVDGRQAPIQDAILQVLQQKGPMTSIETYEALLKDGVATTSGSVYQTLRLMRTKGALENGENDEGTVTWKPAGKANRAVA